RRAHPSPTPASPATRPAGRRKVRPVTDVSTAPVGSGSSPAGGPVLEVTDLTVSFPSEAGEVTAVRGVSYAVSSGEVLGIVGEAGSGKWVSSLPVVGLLPQNARISGAGRVRGPGLHGRISGCVRFRGRELLGLSDKSLAKVRGKGITMVFQDPLSALTPVYTVGDQVAEALRTHQELSRSQAGKRAVELLDLVGIP